MLKSLLCSIFAVFFAFAMAGATEFYRPAQYRWCLESVDLTAGMLSSLPVCQVLGCGTEYPAELTNEILGDKTPAAAQTSVELIISRGMTGEVCAAQVYKPGEKIRLPYLSAGFYSLLFKRFATDGTMVFSRPMCLTIIEDNMSPRPAPAAIAEGIFTASINGANLNVGGLPAGQKELSLHVIARNKFGAKLFEQNLPCPDGAEKAVFSLTAIEPGQVLYLTVELFSPGHILNKTELIYFRKGSYPAKKPDWKSIASVPKQFAADGPVVHENQIMKGPFERNQPGLEALLQGMKQRGSDMINLNFNWSHIEAVRGVYDWSEVDKYVEYFSSKGIAFGIICCGALFNSAPYDVWGEFMMDSTGECRLWRKMCVTSPASPSFRAVAADFVRAFHERYADNPCFKSWTFSAQGLDSGVFMDHFDRVTDYSPWANAVLREFLQKRYGSLDKLNLAWNSSFQSWPEVMPPLPDWKSEVDISRSWLDFNDCKLQIYLDADVRLYDPVVRALDKKSKLSHYLTYTGPIEYAFDDMQKYGSHLNDGGGEAHQMVRLYAIAANRDIRRQPESHYVPADKRLQLQDMIVNSLRYGFINYDLGTVWNSQVNIHAERYPKNANLQDSMRFWSTVVPVLRTLSHTRPLPPPVGFVFSWDDLFCRTRAWRWYALPGEIMQKSAASVSLGNAPWLSGITPESAYDKLKLLVCASDNQVFSPELLNKLDNFVAKGGNLLLCGKAGEYTIGSTEKFLWRNRFKAPVLNASAGTVGWKYGQGQVFYRPEAETNDGKFLVDIMSRCNIARETVSNNPDVQAFLLRDRDDLILVVSGFRGFDQLRKIDKSDVISAAISLPSLPENRKWKVTGLYPATVPQNYDSATLKNNGIMVKTETSGIIIYRMEMEK